MAAECFFIGWIYGGREVGTRILYEVMKRRERERLEIAV